MGKAIRMLLVLIGLFGLASAAHSQIQVTVRDVNGVEVNVGSTHASGDAINLTTRQLAQAARATQNPWWDFEFVRIYDVATLHGGAPSSDIGVVTIDADPSDPMPGNIRVLVAPPQDASGIGQAEFGFHPWDAMPFEGAKNFYGLLAEGCGNVRCAIAVTENIGRANQTSPRDQIICAQVYRLQTRGVQDSFGHVLSGGNVYANVTAKMNSTYFTSSTTLRSSFSAVAYVYAAQSVQGTIVANGAPEGTTGSQLLNSVAKVLVGFNPSMTGGAVFGITGDIKAERGHIGSVLCNGPIGTSAHRSQIRAANGIDEVRIVTIDQSTGVASAVAPFDVNADIAADADYAPAGTSTTDAPIKIIQTDGNLTGSISAGNLVGDGSTPSGILVRGAVNAPITIAYNAEHVSIIGSTFTQPIWIGLTGAIALVATDPVYGAIPLVEIGYASDPLPGYLG